MNTNLFPFQLLVLTMTFQFEIITIMSGNNFNMKIECIVKSELLDIIIENKLGDFRIVNIV